MEINNFRNRRIQEEIGVWIKFCSYIFFPVPGVVIGVQGRYPYVVWNPPDEPNGVITGYRLVFSRSGTSTTRTRTPPLTRPSTSSSLLTSPGPLETSESQSVHFPHSEFSVAI